MLGEPKYITVDDRLPIQDAVAIYGPGYTWANGSRYNAFNSGASESGAWWLPVLEKGFAKFIQTYVSLNGGNEWEALRAMAGMPVNNFKSTDMTAEEIYGKVKVADSKGYVMTAGCHNSIDGLVSGHAYSLLGVNDETGRFVVRNPWSNENYYGEGSDQTNDGIFEVPKETFSKAFTEFTIMYYKDWAVTSLGKQTFSSSTKKWNIYVDTAQEVVITIDLGSERQQAAGCNDPEFIAQIYALEGQDKVYKWW